MRGLFLFIGFFILSLHAEDVHAEECTPSEFSGNWQNVRGEKNILSALEVVDTCDADGPFGAVRTRAKELCHPRDCSWGWVRAEIEGNQLFAEFNTFIAKRRIVAVPQGLKLRVVVETDYITESREDTRVEHLLVRSAGQ